MSLKLYLHLLLSLLLFLGLNSVVYGQMEQYNYKQELKGISDQWHKIILPDEIFDEVKTDLSDIRIFGVTETNETIEAPYIRRQLRPEVTNNKVAFNTLNVAHNANASFFTFEIPSKTTINQIDLNFKEQNFDWRVKLEGSQNQEKWFTLLADYRILGIKNFTTDFQFTKLNFPNSKYRYYRLRIETIDKPTLKVAKLVEQEITDGVFKNYKVKNLTTKFNKGTKNTIITGELELPVPVSHFKIDVSDAIDYYRPITINYLVDSIDTEKGWKYNYKILETGTLNSIDNREFKFNPTIFQKFKIIIYNQDNEPLRINSIKANGYSNELVARFTKPATYYLTYGNKKANHPRYDITQFEDKIPKNLQTLTLGSVEWISKPASLEDGPLFKNKLWLWLVMVVIILVLGGFTLSMMRNK